MISNQSLRRKQICFRNSLNPNWKLYNIRISRQTRYIKRERKLLNRLWKGLMINNFNKLNLVIIKRRSKINYNSCKIITNLHKCIILDPILIHQSQMILIIRGPPPKGKLLIRRWIHVSLDVVVTGAIDCMEFWIRLKITNGFQMKMMGRHRKN